ncbi:MAG: hypothetical protein NTY19_08235 [Planctomycetota bacterium]|nr:hypothetical protein [Planctomycetota bacterium]
MKRQAQLVWHEETTPATTRTSPLPVAMVDVLFVRCVRCVGVITSPYWHFCDAVDPVANRWPAAGLTVEKKTLEEFGDVDWCKCVLVR